MKPTITSRFSIGALFLTAGIATAANILSPTDSIIAIAGIGSNGSYPGGENPGQAVNGNADKYLNFGGKGSGFIVTPAGGAAAVTSLAFTTANDDANRDPARYTIYGTNDAISSADNSNGLSENWTAIHTSTLVLPTDRITGGTISDFSNGTTYSSYKVIFETLRDNNNSLMQIGEVGFFTGAGGTGTQVGLNSPTVGVDYGYLSRYGGTEGPSNILDGDTNTKYLNFGRDGSGFIVTPGAASVAKGFTVTTANDFPGRTPASYSIYGTNSAISSFNNGDGTDEPWNLIQNGTLALSVDPFIQSDLIGISNDTSYTSYKVIFDSLADGNENSMQIADFTLDTVPEPSAGLLSLLGAVALIRRRR